MAYAKGETPRDLDAAKGGASLGRTREFLKEEGYADQNVVKRTPYKNPNDCDYGKSGSSTPLSKRTGDKALPTIKARK